jgi:hypothetical protein
MYIMKKETVGQTAQEVMIPVEESFAEWRKDPKYVASYNALENEFALLPLTND